MIRRYLQKLVKPVLKEALIELAEQLGDMIQNEEHKDKCRVINSVKAFIRENTTKQGYLTASREDKNKLLEQLEHDKQPTAVKQLDKEE